MELQKHSLNVVVSTVEYDTALVNATTIPKAPGMKYTHYAPDAPMMVVVGSPEGVAHTFKRAFRRHRRSHRVFGKS